MNESSTRLRMEAVAIFRAAVNAVDPAHLVIEHLSRHAAAALNDAAGSVPRKNRGPTLVIGAGKAAARMAAGCEQVLGAENVRGEVIVADGCAAELRSVAVSEAGHPLPDARGERAARRIMQLLREQERGDTLCLIGGGASSLLVCPRSPVTLPEKIATTRLLLECGADIRAFNTVRKHLSEVKGGGLLRHVQTRMRALLISDVIGDDPSTIGSGPTVPDDTTFADAWGVLMRYQLDRQVPATVTTLLRSGIEGTVAETVKPNSVEASRCRSLIIGSNRTALAGAAAAAQARGWTVHVDDLPLSGDTIAAARSFTARIQQLAAHRRTAEPLCVLAGGETTVQVKGKGRGGRNQEFALALAGTLAGTPITLLSAGTDGIDGPTDAAGAFVDGTTLWRAQQHGLDVDTALGANDSYTFFSELDDLFRCGPTGTNVMDIKIALVPAATRDIGF
ncbi:MAG: glycerate kinase [Candidatus Binatia bacterium]